MDSGLVDHVLSHVIDADVHDLHRVQSRAPQLRRACRVGRDPMKREKYTEVGQVFICHHGLIGGAWMPGNGGITIIKKAVPHQIRLSAGIFLCRTAVIPDGAQKSMGLHISF